ncbi:MAG: exopolyphosphatase [Lachnospiraceae bacterium]|nr:exopolyphosphatase [Lachnospiraceae bacterium]
MQATTFAAIDIGTYDVTLEIFEMTRKNGINSLNNVKHRMELGKDVFASGKIGQEMADELCTVLSDFVRFMEEYRVTSYRAVATSSLREAENNQFILRKILQRTGLRVEILSNSEQRFIGYKAIASMETDFNKMIEKGTAIIDLDGGSVQISLFDKDALVTTQNIRMGSLRIRERLASVAGDTTHYDTLVEELIQNEILSFKKMYLKDRKIENIVLVGDLFTDSILVNAPEKFSKTLTREEFQSWYQIIVHSSAMELAVKIGIPVESASLLVPSVIIYKRLIEELDAKLIWTPGTRLASGLAYEFGEQKKLIRIKHNFENDILMAARNIGKRYAVSKPHIDNMEMVALGIFDSMKKVHGFQNRERLLLRIAVMLHDVGKYISLNFVADSSYNIIMSNEIIGLSHSEREMIALVAQYNTKRLPQYEVFASRSSLNRDEYLIVAGLTAIVRLANALDRSHLQKIQTIRSVLKENELVLSLSVNKDFTLEEGLSREKQEFFHEVFNVTPVIRIRRQL